MRLRVCGIVGEEFEYDGKLVRWSCGFMGVSLTEMEWSVI